MLERYHGSTAVTIAASVEEAVRAGDLAPGEALPPVRRLADTLGVSPATVAAAYRDLRDRAVVETAGRAGTRVRSRPALGDRRSRFLSVPPGARDLSDGAPDPRLLPTLGPHLARIATLPAHDQTVLYDRAGPLPELLAPARGRLTADGVPAGHLTVTSGTLDGVERVLAAHLSPGDRIAVEDPSWANLLDLLAVLRLEPVAVPVDEDGPTTDGLASALAGGVRAVVLTSRAQNPTGAAITADRAAGLRAVLAGHPGVLVVEDDHAAELAATQPDPVALHPVAPAARHWAFLRSVSKPYGPDLRFAILAGDDATVARVVGRQRIGAGWVSTVLQRLVLELWRDDAVTALVARAAASYAARRDGLVAALRGRGLPATGRTGLNVWVPVADEPSAVARLRDAGWVAAPGSAYRLHSGPSLRLTVSPLDEADVAPLADAVAAAAAPPPHRYRA